MSFFQLAQDALLVLLLVSGYQGLNWTGQMAQDTGTAQGLRYLPLPCQISASP